MSTLIHPPPPPLQANPTLHHPPPPVPQFASSDPIITLKNIHKTYLLGVEGVAALRGVSLQIQRGEWVVIYGTSGGGKTSLLNIIGTIDKPTKGEVVVCDTGRWLPDVMHFCKVTHRMNAHVAVCEYSDKAQYGRLGIGQFAAQ
ncbi:ABC transporter AbcH.1 [Rhizophlyctis rosea]|uniref:ABC transporter AbcH.1 n=1 Tax=Rhizophlyctis rosea TaxID=64517 RepID=A0AAD5WX92_9FUNG|nr:ABC transporter AbcH.1 [Rhizophlyctis rosea]